MDDTLNPIWKALSDPTRRAMLDSLRERPRTTGELATAVEASFGLSRFAVMKHLGILEEAGLVVARRKGRERWNYLNAVPLRRIYERWVSEYASEWASSMLRLEQAATAQPEAENRTGGTTPMNATLGSTNMNVIEIEQEVPVGAGPETVFEALTSRIGEWWDHTFSDAPKGVRLEPRVGGRFFEEYADEEGGVLYGTVTHIKRGSHLTITGPMGMTNAVLGVIRFDLEPREGYTLVKLSHQAIGDVREETRQSYTSGWKAILEKRLKPFAERASG
jgi:DNA-binding transcriptional ArsR family regulator/uncharacterized protein YndB with AHSA1/START domain